MPAVEGTDPDSERQVEGWLAREKFEVLGGYVAHAQQAGRDIRRGIALSECDPGGRPVAGHIL